MLETKHKRLPRRVGRAWRKRSVFGNLDVVFVEGVGRFWKDIHMFLFFVEALTIVPGCFRGYLFPASLLRSGS